MTGGGRGRKWWEWRGGGKGGMRNGFTLMHKLQMRVYRIIMMLEEDNLPIHRIQRDFLRPIIPSHHHQSYSHTTTTTTTNHQPTTNQPPKGRRGCGEAHALINSKSPFFGKTSSMYGSSRGNCSTSFARRFRCTDCLTLVLEEPWKLLLAGGGGRRSD